MNTKYRCDYCDKAFTRESEALKHEQTCVYDPAQKTCATCGHFTAICLIGVDGRQKTFSGCMEQVQLLDSMREACPLHCLDINIETRVMERQLLKAALKKFDEPKKSTDRSDKEAIN
jgi:hypothetical protein